MTTETTVCFSHYGINVCGSGNPVSTARMREFRAVGDGYARCGKCASVTGLAVDAGILTDTADCRTDAERENAA